MQKREHAQKHHFRRNQLDLLDRKLLFELDINCRRSISELSRVLKQSRERVEYRLTRLLDEKIIGHFETTINPKKLGYSIFKTFLRLENNRPMVAELVEHLTKHPRLAWLALCDGSWDLSFCFYANSAEEFYQMHTEFLSQFNAVILNFSSYTLIDVKMYKRGYFGTRRSDYVLLGGGYEPVDIDELDLKILKTIQVQARMPISQVAERVNAAPTVVQYRIERMERENLITGYRIDLDLQSLGMIFMKTQFFLRNYELGLTEQFQEFCDTNPHVSCYSRQIGDCNIEIELHVPSYEVYSETIEEIRGRYSKFIRNFHTLLVSKSLYRWMPSDIAAPIAEKGLAAHP